MGRFWSVKTSHHLMIGYLDQHARALDMVWTMIMSGWVMAGYIPTICAPF